MKSLKFMEIGTIATEKDFKEDIGTLIQIPIDTTTTLETILDQLPGEVIGDADGVVAVNIFIKGQNKDLLDKRIFEHEKIVLDTLDKNQYYMVFNLFEVTNIIDDNKVIIDDKLIN